MFEIPIEEFNPKEHARNKVIRSNQFLELVLQQFTDAYESFWGVSGSTQEVKDKDGNLVLDENQAPIKKFVGGGSRYTTEEMQSVIDALGPQALIAILTQTAGFTQFLNAAYPGILQDQYQTAAFSYTLTQSRVTLGELNHFWSVPEESSDLNY